MVTPPYAPSSLPLIGVTTWRQQNAKGIQQICVSESYIEALVLAGACPVALPVGIPDESIPDLLSHLDGIVFAGGGDIHPKAFQPESHPAAHNIDLARDELEFELFRLTTASRKPFLGICRGLQVINVALGGSLIIDIPNDRPQAMPHDFSETHPRNYLAHQVKIAPSSFFAKIYQNEMTSVNSFHHQAIDRLAPDLLAVAWAPDGIIEAVELTDYPFGIAVQWHPECLLVDKATRALFSTFVKYAKRTIHRE
jgi:putative glutamine amidotransferase